MSDSNDLPHINLATADKSELKNYGIENLGLKLTMSMNEDTMRTAITDKCAQLGLAVPTAEIRTAQQNKPDGHQIKRSKIRIFKQDKPGGAEPAFVGVQGRGYYIPRDIDVIVPASVVEVLNNGVTDVVTQKNVGDEPTIEKVHTYPFTVLVDEVTDEMIASEKAKQAA